MRKVLFGFIFILSFLILTASKLMASVESSQGVIPEQYIVQLKDNIPNVPAVANEMAQLHGLTVTHHYNYALKGFAARIPDARLEILRNDPRVERIDSDRVITAMPPPPGGGNPNNGNSTPPPQTLPTGVNRIDAELNSTLQPVNVDIAILDTGIDLDHPDLNVVNNVTFITGTNSGNDDNGHGSHVSGIAAAKNNTIGVVGVAPGARLWAVKVLNKQGSGSWSTVIAGIDYVTAHASEIEVANMSLGGSGSDTASSLRTAIENSVAAGITYVVSAGNSHQNAANFVPAAYDAVITVSALADSDGQPGGNGPNTSYGADDTFATFSNFGADVDIAAPGVDIFSCWKNDGFKTISGTSMSSPHVAGAAALYIADHSGVTPALVQTVLISSGESGPLAGDPDAFPEPIVHASNL